MQEFVANRMSSGNRLFPDKVTISDRGITLRSAGFMNGNDKTLHYHEIISVESDSPMVGFSTIKFKCVFDSIICSGFTKEQVEEMKHIVNGVIAQNNGYGSSMSPQQPMMNQVQSSHVAQIKLEAENKEKELRLERERIEIEKKKRKEERADKLRQEGRNFHAFCVEYDNAIIGGLVTLGFIIFFIYILNKPK